MEYRIDPASHSQISGMTYAEAVTSVMQDSGLTEEVAQSVIDIKQFAAPVATAAAAAPAAPVIDDAWLTQVFDEYDALGGGDTDERVAFRAGVLAGMHLMAAQPA